MAAREIGLVLVAAGAVAVVVGLLVYSGLLSWFGQLPGDVHFEGRDGRVRLFVPITSMLVVSLALSLILALLRRFLS